MTENYTYESELVARIQAGESGAEHELVNRYRRGIFAILMSRCSDQNLCDDVSQEIWLVIIQKIRDGKLRDSRRLSGFITQIARNQLTMVLRRFKTDILITAESEIEIEGKASNPTNQLQDKQLGEDILKFLSAMPRRRDSELILRFYYYGDTKQELCNRFDLSSASFDSVLARARNRFKKLWLQKK